ncbi:MAG: hypothetical protein CSA68_12610 [Rhodobacterales bacterium]|nr:MAG: hypothetical protein CSA68_12610 [Rhodobacterales bacterium]
MMPKLLRWPRDKEGAPLHFLAQIACADLPAQLWNGDGPRKGWLLLFVETLKLEDEADDGGVRVLHVNRLGPERAPPKDTPTVRHAMSDYIDYAKANIRPGVPKLWRKWPVDLVPQPYDLTGSENDIYGPPHIPAEELYGAPVAERGIWDDFSDMGLTRPLTWQGALYVIEGLARDLQPAEFKRKFTRYRGLLDAPEPDRDGFGEELRKRIAANPSCDDRDVGWGPRVRAITDQIEAELKAERSTGWMARYYVALDKARAGHEGWINKYQKEIEAAGDSLDAQKLESLTNNIESQRASIEAVEKNRAYLDELFAAYPGPEGERRFTEEIKSVGEAHLAWGEKMAKKIDQVFDQIRSKDLSAPLTDKDWADITGRFTMEKSVYWSQTGLVLQKVEKPLSVQKEHLKMAIREDVLDLYCRGDIALAGLDADQLDQLEQKLRHLAEGLPHRMGGQPNPIQGDGLESGEALLFQLTSDLPMGWMWGDVGALYVTISDKNLKKHRFKGVTASIEGH